MNRDIASRADELTFGFREGAVDEGINRVEDSVIEHRPGDGQRWLSAVFELIRRARAADAAR